MISLKQKTKIFDRSIYSSKFIKDKRVIKSQSKKSRFIKNSFFHYKFIVCIKRRWNYISKSFKNNLTVRNSVNSFFDGVISNSSLKKKIRLNKDFSSLIRSFYIQPEYRLDILLWRLHFFSSPYQARIFCLNKKITVNGLPMNFAYVVKGGDIIKINSNGFVNQNLTNKNLSFFFNSFVEVDYFLKTIVVLQNYDRLSISTFPNVIRKPFKVSSHVNYLRKV